MKSIVLARRSVSSSFQSMSEVIFTRIVQNRVCMIQFLLTNCCFDNLRVLKFGVKRT